MKLISDSEKEMYSSVMDDLHDTFKKTCVWLKEGQVLSIATDGNFNFVYGDNQVGVTSVLQQTTGSFDARIFYYDPMVRSKEFPIPEVPLATDKLYVRLKVDPEAKAILENVKEVRID